MIHVSFGAKAKSWNLNTRNVGTKTRKQCKKTMRYFIKSSSPRFLRAVSLEFNFTLNSETAIRRDLTKERLSRHLECRTFPTNGYIAHIFFGRGVPAGNLLTCTGSPPPFEEGDIRNCSATYFQARPRRPKRGKMQQMGCQDSSVCNLVAFALLVQDQDRAHFRS